MVREYILLGDVPAYGRHPVRIEGILEALEQNRPEADLALVQRAYIFAASAHRGAVRHSGEPYLSHPLAVAAILCDLGLDAPGVAAGLLHDTVEDVPTVSIEDIRAKFGPEVAFIVDGVTKFGKAGFSSPAERRAANLRKLVLAMIVDLRVIMVKLADRLHNMRTLDFMSEPKQRSISLETLKFFVPLAFRLDLPQIPGELEALCRGYLKEPAGRPEPLRKTGAGPAGRTLRELNVRARIEDSPKHV